MVSVDVLLDGHEVAVRARVEELRERAARVAVELGEAELALEHVEITRATLTAVLAGQGAAVSQPSEPTTVPAWHLELGEAALPADYRRVWAAVAAEPDGVRAKELAVALGLELVPAKIERLRSKLKRLVGRGWLTERTPGLFAVLTAAGLGPDGGS